MSGRDGDVPKQVSDRTIVSRLCGAIGLATLIGTVSGLGLVMGCGPVDVCAGHTEDGSGGALVVIEVEPWGTAAIAGMRVGDRIEAWRSATRPWTPIENALQLLWVAADQAPRDAITLRGRRGWRHRMWTLEQAAWGLDWMPELPSPLRRAYDKAQEIDDAAAWGQFVDQVAADQPAATAWASWRRGEAQMVDRPEEARRAFDHARVVTQSAEIDALLMARESQALWNATHYTAAGHAVTQAIEQLRDVDPESPAQLLSIALASRCLLHQRQEEAARIMLGQGERLLARWPRAIVAQITLISRAAALDRRAGRFEQAIEQQRRALALALRHHPPTSADVRGRLGQTLGDVGKYEEAAAVFRDLLRDLERSGPDRDFSEASTHNSLGLLNKALGDFERSNHHYRRALALFPTGGFAEAGVRSNLGNLARNRDQLEEAERELRLALTLRQALRPDSAGVASSHHNLGILLRQQGRLEEASAALEQALRLKKQLAPASLLVASTLSELGDVKLTIGDLGGEALLEQAEAIIDGVNPGGLLDATNRLRQGQAYFMVGRQDDAIAAWTEGIDTLEQLRRWLPDELSKARFTARFAFNYRQLATGYLSAEQPERALLTLEAVRARMLRNLLSQHAARGAHTTSADLLAQRRRLDRQLRNVLRRIDGLHPEHDATALRAARQTLRDIRLDRQKLNEQLYLSSPQLRKVEASETPTIEQIRDHLPPGAAGLLYSVGEQETIAFLVHGAAETMRPAVQALELPLARETLRERVEIFRALLHRGVDSSTIEPALVTQAQWLYQALIEPFADSLAEVRQLYIAPDSVMADLPFAALVANEAPLTFLAQQHPHAIVPSLGSLVSLETHARSGRHQPGVELVAFGSPEAASFATTGQREAVGRLPGSRREVEALERLFAPSTRAFLGREATESAVQEWIPEARYVHFATHAVLDARLPLTSMLVLSEDGDRVEEDGVLHGWEILQSPPLAAELVFLAGCETGLGARLRGEGLIGLVQAFHYTGVPAIVASQWRIGDAWVGQFSERFYRQLRARQPPMEALWNTQRALLATKGSANDLSHPHHWAAFTLFGISRTPRSRSAPALR